MKHKYTMRLLVFSVILLFPFFGAAQVEDSLKLEPYFAEAERRIAAYDFDGALKQLSTCYIKRPGHIPYLLRIGYCHTQLGRYPDAKLFYSEALKLDSLHTTALSALGSIYERERNYRKAQSCFTQLTQIVSTNSYYYKKSANIALHQGDALHALQQFIQAHTCNPTDLEVITRLSTIYLAMDELNYAEEIVKKGIQLDARNIPLLQAKARLHHKRKDHNLVASTIEGIMIQGDTSEYYQMMLGVAYLHLDSLELSLAHLQAIVDREEDTEHTHHYLGLVHRKLGNPEQSQAHFEQAIDKGISPKIGLYFNNLGNLAEQQGDLRTAIDHYRSAISYGAPVETHFFLARASDHYFKDKSIALRHYQDYRGTCHKEFQAYTEQRIGQLKEIIHFQQ